VLLPVERLNRVFGIKLLFYHMIGKFYLIKVAVRNADVVACPKRRGVVLLRVSIACWFGVVFCNPQI
jgi:hypothetical protein